MHKVRCNKCNQIKEIDELCAKCALVTNNMPFTIRILESAKSRIKKVERKKLPLINPKIIEYPPDWVDIRWDLDTTIDDEQFITYSSTICIRSSSLHWSAIAMDDLTNISMRAYMSSYIKSLDSVNGFDICRTIPQFLLNNPDADHIIYVLNDTDYNRKEITRICSNLLVASYSEPRKCYYKTIQKLDGSCKVMLISVWFMPIPVIEETVGVWDSSLGEPAIRFGIPNLHLDIMDANSGSSEYTAKCFMQKWLELPDNFFEYEPNGLHTFPDIVMKYGKNKYNIEVTRIKNELNGAILRLDRPNWRDLVCDAINPNEKPASAQRIIDKKSNIVRNNQSNYETILILFSEISPIDYSDIDLTQFYVVLEIDEYTGSITIIHGLTNSLGIKLASKINLE